MPCFYEIPDHKPSSTLGPQEQVIDESHVEDALDHSSLCTLPTEILRRIFAHLLDVDIIKDEDTRPGKSTYTDYHFSIDILRVSKRIHQVAKSVFEDNNWVLISTPGTFVKDELKHRGVWYRDERISKYKAYHLRLHAAPKRVQPEDRDSTSGKNWFLLTPLVQFQAFVNVLAALEFSNGVSFKLLIEFKRHLSYKKQHNILSTFHILQETEDCLINGDIDSELASTFTAVLTSPVHWTRARCWTFVDLSSATKDYADFRFACGDYKDAFEGYNHFFDWWGPAMGVGLDIRCTFDDQNLEYTYHLITSFAAMDQLKTGLLMAVQEPTPSLRDETLLHLIIERDLVQNGYLTPHEYSANQYLYAFVYFANGADNDAQSLFTVANEAHATSCRAFTPDLAVAWNEWYTSPPQHPRKQTRPPQNPHAAVPSHELSHASPPCMGLRHADSQPRPRALHPRRLGLHGPLLARPLESKTWRVC